MRSGGGHGFIRVSGGVVAGGASGRTVSGLTSGFGNCTTLLHGVGRQMLITRRQTVCTTGRRVLQVC